MSLDVYLTKDGQEVYWTNITHNLGKMAARAGIYRALWYPEEDVKTAKDLIEPLTDGLALLRANEAFFRRFDAPNGWGVYEHFVPFVAKYLDACVNNPDAEVRASI
jgi:hypothetical protein